MKLFFNKLEFSRNSSTVELIKCGLGHVVTDHLRVLRVGHRRAVCALSIRAAPRVGEAPCPASGAPPSSTGSCKWPNQTPHRPPRPWRSTDAAFQGVGRLAGPT